MTPPNESSLPSDDTTLQLVPLALSWALVGIPAFWGVWQVVVKSMALFRR